MSLENLSRVTEKESEDISFKDLIIGIRDWVRFLLSKWLTIFIFGMIGGALGLSYAYFKKPVYTATTTFVLENGESGGGALGQYAGLASMVGIDIGGGGGGIFQGDNILELYKSRMMIEKTLLTPVEYKGDKQLLIDSYIDFNKLRNSWSQKAELKNINFNHSTDFSRLQDSILGTIVNDITKNYLNVVKPDKKLSIIKAETKAPDEYFAKVFNEQIVKNVNDFYVQTKTKKSLENVAILQQKTDSVRAVMNGDIYNAAAVTDATPNLNPTRQTQRMAPVQRSQFSAEANKEILKELVKNLELSKISLRKERPLIQIIDEPILPLKKEKLGKSMGISIGGLLFGFLTVLFLIGKKVLKNTISE